MTTADSQAPVPAADHLRGVYAALKRGAGREQVDDDNVEALIQLAHQDGDAQLEYLLREWRSPCGEDAEAPSLAAVQGLPPR